LFGAEQYAVGVARSEEILGQYEKNPANPILHSNEHFSGPGHCSVVGVDGNPQDLVMVYHSWIGQNIGGLYPRVLMLDSLLWTNGWPYINSSSPSYFPTPIPTFA
jgi:arabinan endo-1,5-alpha-L-arabinosidase